MNVIILLRLHECLDYDFGLYVNDRNSFLTKHALMNQVKNIVLELEQFSC